MRSLIIQSNYIQVDASLHPYSLWKLVLTIYYCMCQSPFLKHYTIMVRGKFKWFICYISFLWKPGLRKQASIVFRLQHDTRLSSVLRLRNMEPYGQCYTQEGQLRIILPVRFLMCWMYMSPNLPEATDRQATQNIPHSFFIPQCCRGLV